MKGIEKLGDDKSGTKVSGYVESTVPKKCATCEYMVQGSLCQKDEVQADKEIKTDPKSGLKIVNPEIGCCDFWEPADDEDEDDSGN